MSRDAASPKSSGGRAKRWISRIVVGGVSLGLAAYSTFTISGAVLLAGGHDESRTIRGRVSLSGGVQFAGEAPAPEPIDMAADEYCLSAHAIIRSPRRRSCWIRKAVSMPRGRSPCGPDRRW
jgi:hypothetical protein